MSFHRGQRVEVDAKGSIYDRLHGEVLDVDEKGIVDVWLFGGGPIGESTNLFTADELVHEGYGRPLSWSERLWRTLARLG